MEILLSHLTVARRIITKAGTRLNTGLVSTYMDLINKKGRLPPKKKGQTTLMIPRITGDLIESEQETSEYIIAEKWTGVNLKKSHRVTTKKSHRVTAEGIVRIRFKLLFGKNIKKQEKMVDQRIKIGYNISVFLHGVESVWQYKLDE